MKKKVIIIILVIGLLLIVAGIGFKVFGSKSETSVDDNEKVEQYDGTGEKMSDGQPDKNNYKENSDGSKVNNSEKVSKKHTSENFSVENMTIKLDKDEFFANYAYEITNNGTNNYDTLDVSIIFIFADGTKIMSTPYTIDNFTAGSTTKVEKKEYMSIVGAVDYEIQIGSQTN